MCSGMPRPHSSCASSSAKLLQLLLNSEYDSAFRTTGGQWAVLQIASTGLMLQVEPVQQSLHIL